MSNQRTSLVFCLKKRCPLAGLVLVMTAGLAHGQVISFDASRGEFPEVTGWTRVPFCTPERVFEDGVIAITVEIGECGPPPGGDKDLYTRDLDAFLDTSDAFFAEARLITTGPNTEFTGQGPATFTMASFGPVHYGLTIADDQLKFFRDALLPIPFFDLDPGTEHTFRLETHGDALYELYIDTVLVDSGLPQAAYPQFAPFVNWRSRTWMTESTTRWRFVRLGRIAAIGSADFDTDGQVDGFDAFYINECIERSAAGEPAVPSCSWADTDGDGWVTCDTDWQFIIDNMWTGLDPPPDLPACTVDLNPIPAVSNWGLLIVCLLMLAMATIVYGRGLCEVRCERA